MSRHPHDLRSSTPAVQRARERIEGSTQKGLDVRVDELDEGGVDVKETISAEALSELLDDGKSPRWTGGGDAHLELHLETEASFVRVTGKASFPLVHPCVRCLNDVPFDVVLNVDLRLVQKVKPSEIEADFSEGDGSDDLEGAPLGSAEDLEDLDIASYEGDVVHVDEVLREQLFLDLPMHPACDSPRAHPKEPCAFDASQAKTDGSRGFTASRWAGLASLRDKLPPGPGAPAKNGASPAPKKAESTSTPKPATPAAATIAPATNATAKTPPAEQAKSKPSSKGAQSEPNPAETAPSKASKSNASQSKGTKSKAAKSKASTSSATKSEASKSKASKSKGTKSEVSKSKGTKSKASR